jgi:hypothetical protein
LLSIIIRCPNHLSSLLSTISVTGTSFSILQIWLFLYLALLVCLHYLISLLAIPLSHLV